MKRTVTKEELDRPLVPYEEALRTILSGFAPLPPVQVPVEECLGLVLAERVTAGIDVPGFDNSAMDGYAIVAEDTAGSLPVTLRLVDDLPAGSAPAVTITRGTAATIMTGAPLPPGADAVIPWEDTEPGAGEVIVKASIASRRNVRPRGEDVAAGTEIADAGTVLKPVHAGVLASVGRTQVMAHPRPRIAVASTGDELVPTGGTLAMGQVFDSNQALIGAAAEHAGGRVVASTRLADDPDAIGAWMAQAAAAADLIVTSGGASVGEHDWIRAILEKEGSLSMWRVAIKPGKPIAFGTIAGTKVLALPGNPGSAFVGLHVFVSRAIRIMAGRSAENASVQARLTAAVKGSPSRTQFTRVVLREDRRLAEPLPAQSSVVLSNLLGADGFAIVPPGGLPEGSEVTVELL